jgi:Ca2+/Na+ antiporter
MGLIDITLYLSIAIIYNLFVHNLASMSYKDLQYEDKQDKTIVMLIIFGIIGIAFSKLVIDKNNKYKNSIVSQGLYFGGILLILTAIFTNWQSLTEELKLLLISVVFGLIVWYSYNYTQSSEKQNKKRIIQKRKVNEKAKEEIINDQIIDHILDEMESKYEENIPTQK